MRHAAATLGRRAADHFIAPPDDAPPLAAVPALPPEPPAAGVIAPLRDGATPPLPRPATVPPATHFPPRVAVLGPAREATPIAVALGNALRADHDSPAAAVAIWDPAADEAPPAASPAAPGASRLAARLTARGLEATARGRLAWLRLDSHPVSAVLAARKLSAAVEVPVVVVLAGPRTAVLERLLREQDLVVVVIRDPGGALARVAVSTSEVPAVATAPLSAPARVLATSGLTPARWLDPRVRVAVKRVAEPVPIALVPGAAR